MATNDPIPNDWLQLEAPAKVNLMLSVNGLREDGFHRITSLMVPVGFGDTLRVRANNEGGDRLTCDQPFVPVDDSNLVLKSAQVFREATGFDGFFDFHLIKRMPVGAGLGGGSSDAVAALKAMDRLADTRLDRALMRTLSAKIGSDCPFFVDAVPAWVRGRGEWLKSVDEAEKRRLQGLRLLLFRPSFGIETAWAYGRWLLSRRLIMNQMQLRPLESSVLPLAEKSEISFSIRLRPLSGESS